MDFHFPTFLISGPKCDYEAAREFMMNSYMDLNEDKEKMLYYHYTCATGMLIPAQLSPPWHNSHRHL